MSYSKPSSSRQAGAIPQGLRHIKIFSTPAGTPSISGKDTRPSNWARWFPAYIQHWGIFVESPTDGLTGGTFFELAFPEGVLGIMRRSKSERNAEERKNGRWIEWADTELLTHWTDDEIEREATRLCRDELQSDYDVRRRNCQTFVNLLVQTIIHGNEPYIPRHTASHAFRGSGPSDEHLIVTRAEDRAKAVPFRGTKQFAPPPWDKVAVSHEHLWKEKENVPIPRGAQGYIDLNEAERPEGPITIDRSREVALAYARGEAGPPRPEWTPPPQFSVGLPHDTIRTIEQQRMNQMSQNDSPFQPPFERFIGPRTAYVQHIADSIENHFNSAIERSRGIAEREAEYERWEKSGKLSEEQLRVKLEELKRLNSITLTGDTKHNYDHFQKDQDFYKRNRQQG